MLGAHPSPAPRLCGKAVNLAGVGFRGVFCPRCQAAPKLQTPVLSNLLYLPRVVSYGRSQSRVGQGDATTCPETAIGREIGRPRLGPRVFGGRPAEARLVFAQLQPGRLRPELLEHSWPAVRQLCAPWPDPGPHGAPESWPARPG